MTAAAGFDARLVHTDHEAAVVVHGEIDLVSCGRLWAVMEQAISLSPRLVLDLAETTYIDSCGLALIVRAHRRLGQPRGAVVIRSPGPAARKLLSVTGVDRLVTIEDPRDGLGGGPGTNRARPTAPPRPDDPLPDPTRGTMARQQANGSGETLVTFRLPADVGATTASIVGEFNDWSPDAHPMRREDDAFTAVIPLMPGHAYRFRYLLDGERWLNDWAADAYVPNEFGGDDSVVDLTDLPPVELPTDGATVEGSSLHRELIAMPAITVDDDPCPSPHPPARRRRSHGTECCPTPGRTGLTATRTQGATDDRHDEPFDRCPYLSVVCERAVARRPRLL